MSAKTVVGLDIGSTRIRGVEATLSGGKPNVIGVASLALDVGVVEGGEIKDTVAFTAALKDLWKQGKFISKDVRIVINSEKNVAKLTTLDDEIDFAKTLPFKLKKREVFDINKYYLSYHTIRKYNAQEADSSAVSGFKTVPRRDILLAGATKESIDTLIKSFNAADLRALSVDIAPLSMIRAESRREAQSLDPNDRSIDIHINVGGDMTTIVVSHQLQPVYIRIIDIGGNTITYSLVEQLNIDYKYAEQLKIETLSMNPSLIQRDSSNDNIFTDSTAVINTTKDEGYTRDQMDAYTVVNDELSSIIQNINRTIIYFTEQNQMGLGREIDTIYISGGTAAFPQIRTRLNHEIGAKQTILSNPFSLLAEKGLVNNAIEEQFLEKQHEYTLSIGALLGNGGSNNG